MQELGELTLVIMEAREKGWSQRDIMLAIKGQTDMPESVIDQAAFCISTGYTVTDVMDATYNGFRRHTEGELAMEVRRVDELNEEKEIEEDY